MIIRAVVPIVVSNGSGSVTIPARNSAAGFSWCYMNGECIQVGLILPNNSASGSFYCFDNVKFVPISGNFSGPWNWNGCAGLVGDITVNVISSTPGVYAAVFIFRDGRPQQ